MIITWSVCLDKLHKFHAYKTLNIVSEKDSVNKDIYSYSKHAVDNCHQLLHLLLPYFIIDFNSFNLHSIAESVLLIVMK